MPDSLTLDSHYAPKNLRDRIAFGFIRFLRFCADAFFSKRYGHRAIVLETVAALPGMVGGTLQHLRSLRRMKTDSGWIHTLLDEAENERQHLLTFMHIAKPTWFEKLLVRIVQVVFYMVYFLLYLISPRTAHRVVGYLEEEAVHSYSQYLAGVEDGTYANVAAPEIAIAYWKLAPDARLREVIIAVRADECLHRDVNHDFANELDRALH
ncbi:MAG: alternative oxidase [Sideroxyarcus sp.]|nr:alternative oxidase [Sideroxyarcus sp.]